MELDKIVEAVGIKPYHQEEAGVIWCADCRDILPKLPKVDLVLTDPPYNTGKLITNLKSKISWKQDTWKWDKEIDSFDFICPSITFVPPNKIKDFDRLLVAVKNQTSCSRNVSPRYGCQFLVVKGKLPLTFELDWFQYDPVYNGIHPTEKSLKLMKWLVRLGSLKNQVILDPFLGSGTTAIAAKELNRKFIGIEIDEEYCRIAVRRLGAWIPESKERKKGLLL